MLENETQNQIEAQNETRNVNKSPVELQINNPKLAHAYVPFQYITEVYEPDQGLQKATIFPQLYMPYENMSEMPVVPVMPMMPVMQMPMPPAIDERS